LKEKKWKNGPKGEGLGGNDKGNIFVLFSGGGGTEGGKKNGTGKNSKWEGGSLGKKKRKTFIVRVRGGVKLICLRRKEGSRFGWDQMEVFRGEKKEGEVRATVGGGSGAAREGVRV